MTEARVTEEPRDRETITRGSVVAAGWATAPPTITHLTHAYRITGDEEYLKIATRHFATMDFSIDVQRRAKYLDGSGAVISDEGCGRFFADRYTSLLLYAGVVTPLGLLDWYEYPYQRESGKYIQNATLEV